jgi:hypothetical protein
LPSEADFAARVRFIWLMLYCSNFYVKRVLHHYFIKLPLALLEVYCAFLKIGMMK